MPKIKYQEFNFRPATLDIIEKANTIIIAYQRQGFILTLRQLYYQFVSRGFIANNQNSYNKLGGIINWKTSRIVATRMKNEPMGWFVQLDFPKNPNDCDREEIEQFIEMNGGSIFEGGGFPGAPAMVKFDGVKDKAALDQKLKQILPGLTTLVAKLDDKVYTKRFAAEFKQWDLSHNPQWPDTSPPDKSDLQVSSNTNGLQYKKEEVSPGKWQWVLDVDAMHEIWKLEQARRDLFYALTHRVLTIAEYRQALEYGSRLNIEPMVTYSADEKLAELNRAFELQKMMREAAAIHSCPPEKGDR